jgi:protein-L-isoaspartate(D-aspartate) O-methyltransferase
MFGKNESFEQQRKKMILNLRQKGITDENVLKAIREIPREKFVLQRDLSDAYADGPLPIDCGQTISQPYMVAIMTECLELKGNEKVLEIGTGSGYQTAVLAKLAYKVYTIERHTTLRLRALDALDELSIENVIAIDGDGTKGLANYAPYNGIIVTAGAPDWPKPLKEQLADGGRLVAPLGGMSVQMLKVLTKKGKSFNEREVCACKFVNLIGEYGWSD